MKRIKNIIFSIIFLSSYSVFSQSSIESVEGLSFEERLFYGGGFGLNFGTNMMIELSP